MVDVDVDVQDTLVIPQQLEYAEDDVCGGQSSVPRLLRTVDVAKAARLGLLGVVQTARPIDGDVALVSGESSGTLCPASERPSLIERTHRAAGGD